MARSVKSRGLRWLLPGIAAAGARLLGDDCNHNRILDTEELAPAPLQLAPSFRVAAGESAGSLRGLDLNGDGRPDAAFTEHVPPSVAIAWNTTGGPPRALDRVVFAHAPTTLAAADLTGDGLPELAAASPQVDRVVVLTRLAPGQSPQVDQVPSPAEEPGGLAAGDADGDGDVDLVLLTGWLRPQATVVLLRNLGRGELAAGEPVELGVGIPKSLYLADASGDGRLDVLVGRAGARPFLFLVNDGSGRFPGRLDLVDRTDGAVPPPSFASGDIDEDGLEDAVWVRPASQSQVKLLWGSAAEVLHVGEVLLGASQHTLVGLGDLDGDGRTDLVAVGSLSRCSTPGWALHTRPGAGGRRFDAPFPIARLVGPPRELAAADWDMDGAAEVLLAGDAGPDGSALAVYSRVDRTLVRDCDGNGVPDDCDPDCDLDSVPDACQLAADPAADCNRNGELDACEPDCDGNGKPDDCDLAARPERDCNGDGVLDPCQLEALDLDANGRLDPCEDVPGPGADCNGNGVADATDVSRSLQLDALLRLDLAGNDVLTADFDGDGDLDLAQLERGGCCALHPGKLRLQWNTGGVLVPGDSLPVGVEYWTAAPADFDGDGIKDVALLLKCCLCESTDRLLLVARTPDGGLRAAGSLSLRVDRLVRALEPGDFDGDGDEDLALLDRPGLTEDMSAVRLFWSRGGGELQEGPRASTTSDLAGLHAVDLDGDGDDDLLLRHTGSPRLDVWLSHRAEFTPLTSIPAPNTVTFSAAGDLDGDGRIDAIAGQTNGIIPCWNEGGGRFTPGELARLAQPTAAAAGDVDGDGRDEVIVETTEAAAPALGPQPLLALYGWFGGRQASEPAYLPRVSGSSLLRVGRVGPQGAASAILIESSPIAGSGKALLVTPPLLPRAPAAAQPVLKPEDGPVADVLVRDWNGDARGDAALASPFRVSLVESRADGSSSLRHVEIGQNPVRLAAGDLDGDARADLVTANHLADNDLADTVSVLWGENGTFGSPRGHAVGKAPVGLWVEDLDGDGDADVLTVGDHPTGAGGAQLALLENIGGRSFRAQFSRLNVVAAHAAALQDFNGDGGLDLAIGVLRAGGEAVVQVHLGSGRGQWEAAASFAIDLSNWPRRLGPADVDGDGDIDLAYFAQRLQLRAELLVLRNAGAATFTVETLLDTPALVPSPEFLLLDAENDGRIDVFSFGEWMSKPVLAVGPPGSTDGGVRYYRLTKDPALARAGDADGDADLDVLLVSDRSELDVLANTSAGHSRDENGDGVPDECGAGRCFRRGDANRDSRLDVSDAVTLLRHLFGGLELSGCDDALDSDDDGLVNITDPVAILLRLFAGRDPLPEPAVCGQDPTADGLGCAENGACQPGL